MSKIYGFCEAGCKREVVAKEKYDALLSEVNNLKNDVEYLLKNTVQANAKNVTLDVTMQVNTQNLNGPYTEYVKFTNNTGVEIQISSIVGLKNTSMDSSFDGKTLANGSFINNSVTNSAIGTDSEYIVIVNYRVFGATYSKQVTVTPTMKYTFD